MNEISQEQVIAYLRDNPDFFSHHPELLPSLALPHSPLGASSLLVRQQQMLRDKNNQLHGQLQELIEQARRNEQIYQVFSACHRLLMTDLDFHQLAESLQTLICQQLPLNECRLLPFTANLHALVEHRLKDQGHYLGRLNQQEQKLLFEHECQSAAIYLIGESDNPIAILAFASRDEMHFDPTQDSLFVGEFVKALRERLASLA